MLSLDFGVPGKHHEAWSPGFSRLRPSNVRRVRYSLDSFQTNALPAEAGTPYLRVARGCVKFSLLKRCFLSLILFGTLCAVKAAEPLIEKADALERKGQFKEAATLLEQGIQRETANPEKVKSIEFERHRLERIKKDYPLSK